MSEIEDFECINCGDTFRRVRGTKKKYCSKSCKANATKQNIPKICVGCSVEFLATDDKHMYCSNACWKDSNPHPNAVDRFQLFKRDKFRCYYCGSTPAADEVKLHADHVIPRSKGGEDTFDNLVTACSKCNISKSDSSLSTEIIEEIKTYINHQNEKQQIHPKRSVKF